MDQARLRNVATEMRQELAETEARAARIRAVLDGIEDLLTDPSPVRAAPMLLPLPNGKKPPVKVGVAIILTEFNHGMTLTEITNALWERKWIGPGREGKPSRESVRAVLLALQKQGLTRGEKHGASAWAETSWFLTAEGRSLLQGGER